MPRRTSLKQQLQLLQEKKAALNAEMSCLAESRRSLLLRHLSLQAWCECLELMHVCERPDKLATSSASTNQEGLEASLLRQLTSVSSSGHSYAAAVAEVLHPGMTTIAPVGDPMRYFRHHIFRPPLEAAATMTAMDLARMLREATLQGSMLLHIMQQIKSSEALGPIQDQLQRMWDRVLHASVSLILIGREHIVETMNITNLDSLSPDPEAAQHVAARVSCTVQALQLTPKQTAIIATGTRLYRQLLQKVLDKRQQLQMEFAHAAAVAVGHAAAPGGDCLRPAPAAAAPAQGGGAGLQQRQRQHPSLPGSSGANRSSSSGSASSIWNDNFDSRQAQLKAEQERIARLRKLLRKEYILRMGGAAWVVGCLSWSQVTHAAVLSWPFPVSFSLIASQVQQQWDAQQQQQQQQCGLSGPTQQHSGSAGGCAGVNSQRGSSSLS